MCSVAYPNAADKGKSDAVWKVADPGLKMTSTPINPIVTAAHLRGPTISFKKTTEKMVINNPDNNYILSSNLNYIQLNKLVALAEKNNITYYNVNDVALVISF